MNAQTSRTSDWPRLFSIACDLIDQVNEDMEIITDWTFGGGTAMMLQIEHRESHDVDIFLSDPQHLSFLNPETRDFRFQVMPNEYEGDGTRFRKFAFKNIGEIDFIVASHCSRNPTYKKEIEGRIVCLETIGEIISKKVCYRGTHIKPRDIFDIAAASQSHEQEVIDSLRQNPDELRATISYMKKLKPEFVTAAINDLMIRSHFKDLRKHAYVECGRVFTEASKE